MDPLSPANRAGAHEAPLAAEVPAQREGGGSVDSLDTAILHATGPALTDVLAGLQPDQLARYVDDIRPAQRTVLHAHLASELEQRLLPRHERLADDIRMQLAILETRGEITVNEAEQALLRTLLSRLGGDGAVASSGSEDAAAPAIAFADEWVFRLQQLHVARTYAAYLRTHIDPETPGASDPAAFEAVANAVLAIERSGLDRAMAAALDGLRTERERLQAASGDAREVLSPTTLQQLDVLLFARRLRSCYAPDRLDVRSLADEAGKLHRQSLARASFAAQHAAWPELTLAMTQALPEQPPLPDPRPEYVEAILSVEDGHNVDLTIADVYCGRGDYQLSRAGYDIHAAIELQLEAEGTLELAATINRFAQTVRFAADDVDPWDPAVQDHPIVLFSGHARSYSALGIGAGAENVVTIDSEWLHSAVRRVLHPDADRDFFLHPPALELPAA